MQLFKQEQHPKTRTGRIRPTTTDHALLYTYYVGGGREIPGELRAVIGESIAGDPVCIAQASAGVRPKAKRPRLYSAYLASETSYDGHEETKNSEPPGYSYVQAMANAVADSSAAVQPAPACVSRMQAVNAGSREKPTTSRMQASGGAASPVPAPMPPAGSSPLVGVVTPAQAGAVLREQLSNNHEFLQLLRLALRNSNDDEDGSNRGKNIHKPGAATRRLHEFFTALEFQGTSPHSFVMRVAASAVLQCFPYPAIIVFLYHLAFGRGGLSIMHLESITLLEKMMLQETNTVNMMYYGAHISVPTARKAKTWADLPDAVKGFVAYCNMFCDPTTARLASTIAGFVAAMQSYGNWPEAHLQALVYWINDRLEAYRALVDQFVHEGTGNPSDALSWFSPSNPDLVPLQNTMIRHEINALQFAHQSTATHSSLNQNHARQDGTAGTPGQQRVLMTPAVRSAIPVRQNQELYLRFASKKGYRVSGATCGFGNQTRGHFVDKSLPRSVRSYIVAEFGVLSADYEGSN